MSYIECPECGQKALSVATRCPRCGHNYPQLPIWKQATRSGPGRLRPFLPIAGVLAAGVIIVVLIGRLAHGPTTATRPGAPGATALPSQPVQPPDRSAPVASAGSTAPAARPARAPATPPASPAVTPEVRRYARTWVNVRRERARGAPTVRVLRPGEGVVVDSLRRGWYRVLAGGRPVGYVYRLNLAAAPPPQR
ncbi:MAG: hypothetical protein ACJ8DJ_19270 [Gemmatimonadales bacterium]